MSLGVVCCSVVYFASGYWNFYSALKSNLYYFVEPSNDEYDDDDLQVVPSYDDLHFWLKAASFLSMVVMALFSLAALAVVCADRCSRRKVI